jgi:putative ABC transport system substrate-binding protein
MPVRYFAIALTAAIALSTLAMAVGAAAQPRAKLSRIGLLDAVPPSSSRQLLWDAFRHQLRELGYKEGEHVVFELRSASGQTDKLAAAAAELAALKVDVIVAPSTAAVLAARRATTTIPIVMTNTADPVGTGLVGSLAHPGGNVTGLTTLSTELGVKRLELLRELVPALSRVAVLWQPVNPPVALHDTQAAARSLGVQVVVFEARAPEDIGRAVFAAIKERAQALLVLPGPLVFAERRNLAELAAEHRLPAVYSQREYVDAGGLAAYGSSLSEHFARAAHFVDKILKGAKPADLPVEQPTKFELVVNLRAAKTLGLTIAPPLLLRADKIIE